MYSKLAIVAVVALVAAAASVRAEEFNCAAEGRVCQNGGVCYDVAQLNSNTPGNGGNGYVTPYCVCPAGFGGQDCSMTIRECKDSPCQNGGTCNPATCMPSGSNAISGGLNNFQQYDCFTCTCPQGWTGAPAYATTPNSGGLCDWKIAQNNCDNNRCENGGNCTTNSYTSYTCQCTSGYRGGTNNAGSVPNNVPVNCTIPYCQTAGGECLNGGTCAANGDCQCGNYGGRRCEVAPFCDSNPCAAGATCTNFGNGQGQCTNPGWCTQNTCANGGTCTGTPFTTPSCACVSPYDGLNGCNATRWCSSNNGGSPCLNGGTCTDTLNTLRGGQGTCTCPKGWIGDRCEIQLTGCGRDTVGCSPNASGFSGTGCPCRDVATCQTNNYNNKCNCPATTGGVQYYDCRCNSTSVSKCPGNSGVATGRNVDMVCQNGGTCAETADRTGCQCRPGFWGESCENYDTPCATKTCQNGGRCYIMNAETSGLPLDDRFWPAMCQCKWPYYGENCELVAPRSTDGRFPPVCDGSPCQNGGTCTPRNYDTARGNYLWNNLQGSLSIATPYQCTCPTGYGGYNCELVLERCSATTCGTMGACRNTNSYPGVACTCPCGWAGDRCEVQATNMNPTSIANYANDGSGGVGYRLDFCSNSPCVNGGSCSTAINGQGFQCICPSGYAGTTCQNRVRSAATGVLPSIVAVAVALAAAFALQH